ncbi:MAG: hypothetical protein ACI8ZM_003883 [Crocinitomix sp.]|jgi:hypothetical protein
MKTAKNRKYSKSTILILISMNWAVMLLLTSYFVNDNDSFTSILWTLIIGFVLQLGFLSDQLSNKKK